MADLPPVTDPPASIPWVLLVLVAFGIGVGASVMSLPGPDAPRLGERDLAMSVRGTAVAPSFPSPSSATQWAESERSNDRRQRSTRTAERSCSCREIRNPLRQRSGSCKRAARLSKAYWDAAVPAVLESG